MGAASITANDKTLSIALSYGDVTGFVCMDHLFSVFQCTPHSKIDAASEGKYPWT
jgi:hypothetical protein